LGDEEKETIFRKEKKEGWKCSMARKKEQGAFLKGKPCCPLLGIPRKEGQV